MAESTARDEQAQLARTHGQFIIDAGAAKSERSKDPVIEALNAAHRQGAI
jgi:hypothetical protein